MAESISVAGLVVALLLPWLLGIALVLALLRRSGSWNWFIVTGHGYLAGCFVTSLVIRLWDSVGVPLEFWPLAIVLSLLTVALMLTGPRTLSPVSVATSPRAAFRWEKVLIFLFIGLIAWRYLVLCGELTTRPLYSWDAWMNWVPRAIVWFHHGELTDYVTPHQWLEQAADAGYYTLGNYKASTYPPTVPLILLWMMLGAGTWDHSLILLPWLLAPLCLGSALFGHLRLSGCSTLPAIIAVYLLLSLPYVNVHSALAGYADIWLAAAFAMAVFALYEWRRTGHWSFALLSLFMAMLCSQLKVPGIVLGLIILCAAIRQLLGLGRRAELVLTGILLATVVYVLTIGLRLDLAGLGHIEISREAIELPRFGRLALHYHPVSGAFVQTLFTMINWNLLWYLIPAVAVYLTYKRFPGLRLESEVLASLLGLAFVFFVFYFTGNYKAALNFTTVDRALLYPVPALVFVIFLQLERQIRSSAVYDRSPEK